MTHPAYRNPPIVEAIVALTFSSDVVWTGALLAEMERKLKTTYPGRRRVLAEQRVEAKFGSSVSATAATGPERIWLYSADERAIATVGSGVLTIHVLAPYPGWGAFLKRITKTVGVVLPRVQPASLSEIAVRYVNRIALPRDAGQHLGEYFPYLPRRPASMPLEMLGFQSIVESRDPATGTLAILTTAVVPPGPGEFFAMVFDLNLLRRHADVPVSETDWREVLVDLHAAQHAIFEDSITPKTRELFR